MPIAHIAGALRTAVRLRRLVRGPKRPTWDVDLEAWASVLHHYSKRSTRLPLSFQRYVLSLPPRSRITRRVQFEEVSAGGVRAEWFRAPGDDDARALLYLHGGGYSIGSIDTHRDFVTRLCLAMGFPALVIDYRLAPEHRFPAQVDDALAAYRWLVRHTGDAGRVVVAGDSAGGGLTFSTLLAARDAGDPLPAGAFALSPWVDLEATGASMVSNAPYDYVSREVLHVYARRFVRPHEHRHPLAAPLHADLRGLPPLLVQAGGAEVLLDDARQIVERARAAGVDATLDVEPDMIHVWPMIAPMIPRGRAAIERAAAFLRACIADRRTNAARAERSLGM